MYCQPNASAEPFGLTFVEAMYAGLPVVGTCLGGPSETVDASCGVLVEPGDVAALARALDGLIADPTARARLGAAGPGRAAELCDPARVLDQLHALLEDFVASSTGTGASGRPARPQPQEGPR